MRRVIKEELTEAVPSITKDAKEETEKKWSDLFTKNQQKTPSNGLILLILRVRSLQEKLLLKKTVNVTSLYGAIPLKASLLMMMTMSVLRTGLTVMHLS